jgi:hypothetical protein
MTTHSCNSAVHKYTHEDILQWIMPEPRKFTVVSYFLYWHSGQTVDLLSLCTNTSLPYKSNVHNIKYRSQKVHQVSPEILTKCWMTHFYTFFVIILQCCLYLRSYSHMMGWLVKNVLEKICKETTMALSPKIVHSHHYIYIYIYDNYLLVNFMLCSKSKEMKC